jgi:hypothetical protein
MSRRAGILLTAAVLALGACDGTPDPTPITAPSAATSAPSVTPTSPEPPPIPDPRAVPVGTLLRPGASPDAVLYGEMNGVAPEEIVVLSSTPASDPQLRPIPFLEAYAWDPAASAWVEVFDAGDYQDAKGRGPILAANDAEGQDVPSLQLLDFAGDETLELVVGVQTYGASIGPFELWVLSWLSESFSTEFVHTTERGGHVAFADRTVSLETGVYRPGDPGCCPSAFETLLIGWDPGRGRIVVLNRTEREATQ